MSEDLVSYTIRARKPEEEDDLTGFEIIIDGKRGVITDYKPPDASGAATLTWTEPPKT